MEMVTVSADAIIVAYWIFVTMVLVSLISIASAWTSYEENRH